MKQKYCNRFRTQYKSETRIKIYKFKLLNVDYHKSINAIKIEIKKTKKKRKFINQFALLDHTRLMRENYVDDNILINCK